MVEFINSLFELIEEECSVKIEDYEIREFEEVIGVRINDYVVEYEIIECDIMRSIMVVEFISSLFELIEEEYNIKIEDYNLKCEGKKIIIKLSESIVEGVL